MVWVYFGSIFNQAPHGTIAESVAAWPAAGRCGRPTPMAPPCWRPRKLPAADMSAAGCASPRWMQRRGARRTLLQQAAVCIVLATRLAAADDSGGDVDLGGDEGEGSWEPENWHHCDGTQCVEGFGGSKNYHTANCDGACAVRAGAARIHRRAHQSSRASGSRGCLFEIGGVVWPRGLRARAASVARSASPARKGATRRSPAATAGATSTVASPRRASRTISAARTSIQAVRTTARRTRASTGRTARSASPTPS